MTFVIWHFSVLFSCIVNNNLAILLSYDKCGKYYVRYIVISKGHVIIGDRHTDQQIFV